MVKETVTNWNDMLGPSQTNVGVACALLMQVKTRLKLFIRIFQSTIHPFATCCTPATPTHLHPHTQPHTLPYPLPFGVGDEYSRRNQGKRSPSGLLELICQVGDPPIPIFNHLVGSCLSSACAFSVSQAMASSSKCILQWYSCLPWHSYSYLTASMHTHSKALCWCLTVWCMLTYLTSSPSWYATTVDKGLWIRPSTTSQWKLRHANLINVLNFLTKFIHRVFFTVFQLFIVSLWRIFVIKL